MLKEESAVNTIEYFADIPEGRKLLEKAADRDFLKKVCAKYHYPEGEFAALYETASHIRECMLKEAAFSFGTISDEKQNYRKISAVITLGEGIDRLQEDYTDKDMLSESYMAEVISGEILTESYKVLNRIILKKTGFYVERYVFPGSTSECNIEEVQKLVNGCGLNVVVNSAVCMVPKKSVAFYAVLTDDANTVCEGICRGCGRSDCPNRAEKEAFNYGFARIFGRNYQ
jgi:hypothetical protein